MKFASILVIMAAVLPVQGFSYPLCSGDDVPEFCRESAATSASEFVSSGIAYGKDIAEAERNAIRNANSECAPNSAVRVSGWTEGVSQDLVARASASFECSAEN